MEQLISTVVVPALVNLIIVGLIGGSFKRWLDRRDQDLSALKAEVTTLRDEKFKALKDNLSALDSDNRSEHAGFRDDAMFFRTHFVHVKTCAALHEKSQKQIEQSLTQFAAVTVDLAKVQERAESVMNRQENLADQLTGYAKDLARLHGQMGK